MRIGKIISLFSLMALFIAAPGTASLPSKTFNVGIALRLNDKFNDTVSEMVTGIETAKTIFEEEHPGVKVVFHRYAHDEPLDSVIAAADRAVNDHVPAVIGGELSEESIVLGDRLGEKKIVLMTPTSTNPKVTEGHPYVFRACFSDALVAEQLAKFTLNKLKPTAVGVVHNVSSPYTDFLSNKFLETWKNSKTTIPIYDEKFFKDGPGFTEIIQHFKEKGVTHVAMLTHQNDFSRFALEAANKNFFPVYIGSDGWGSNENVRQRLVNDAPNGARFRAYRNSYWKEDAQTPMVEKFRATYKKKYGLEPNAWSAISFDSAWVLLTAMNEAHDPASGDSIRQALTSVKKLHLVTADQFTFGPDHSPRKDLYIYRLDKSGIKYEATLK